jgi:hypothetical protein
VNVPHNRGDSPPIEREITRKLLRDSLGFIRGQSMQEVLEWMQETKEGFRTLEFYLTDKRMTLKTTWAAFRRPVAGESWTGVGTVISLREEHWVAVYVSKRDRTVDYYDLFGKEPPVEVREVLEEVGKRVGAERGSGTNYTLSVSDAKHQWDSVSCGILSLAFLYERQKNRKFIEVTTERNLTKRMLDLYIRTLFKLS